MRSTLGRSLVGGLVCLAVALLVYPQVSAAATSYTEDWTVTSWRVALIRSEDKRNWGGAADPTRFNPEYPQSILHPQAMCIGPAAWKVTGNVGGRSYEESWTVTNWLETTNGAGVANFDYGQDDGLTVEYENRPTCDYNSGFGFDTITFHYQYLDCRTYWSGTVCRWGPTVGYGTAAQVIPTGLYGGLVTHYGEVRDIDFKPGNFLYKSGIRSVPLQWQVTGRLL